MSDGIVGNLISECLIVTEWENDGKNIFHSKNVVKFGEMKERSRR